MGAAVEIVAVRPDSREETEFIQLPLRLYADSPHYVPWFERSMKNIIARRHPFFEHSDGECFIARRDGHTVGRVAMLEPKRYNDYHKSRDARFYFIELEDDQAVANALFDHAAVWARARGLTDLVGPQGFSSLAGSGILIHGFDRTASMTMMPYQHAYYRGLVEAAGFEKEKDFHSPYLDASTHDLTPKYARAAEIAMKRGRFWIPDYRTKRELRAVAQEIREAYNDAWRERDVFTPLTEAELDQLVDELLLVSDPSLIRVLRSGDTMAGFILAFPDLSGAMVKARGKLNLLTYLRLMWEKRRTRRFLINGFGLRPEYRGAGGTELLFFEITRILKERGVEGAEMTQIAADNEPMMANVERLNADIVKTHRVYRKAL
ncbi:MAG TPA: hypothetical protein VKA06_03555 [Spirochaetia bacterium]|nr:hypothetical protein [Spirochaetia bacterium]